MVFDLQLGIDEAQRSVLNADRDDVTQRLRIGHSQRAQSAPTTQISRGGLMSARQSEWQACWHATRPARRCARQCAVGAGSDLVANGRGRSRIAEATVALACSAGFRPPVNGTGSDDHRCSAIQWSTNEQGPALRGLVDWVTGQTGQLSAISQPCDGERRSPGPSKQDLPAPARWVPAQCGRLQSWPTTYCSPAHRRQEGSPAMPRSRYWCIAR